MKNARQMKERAEKILNFSHLAPESILSDAMKKRGKGHFRHILKCQDYFFHERYVVEKTNLLMTFDENQLTRYLIFKFPFAIRLLFLNILSLFAKIFYLMIRCLILIL